MTQVKDQQAIKRHIVEIRYRPMSIILDERGRWTRILSQRVSLDQWHIIDNRIDVFDERRSERVFVAFRNCGFVRLDCDNVEQFLARGVLSVKSVLDLPDFPDPLHAERIGVRSSFLFPFPGTFEALRERFCQRYVSVTTGALGAIHGDLLDVGASLDLCDKIGSFNTVAGPMRESEMKRYIDRPGEYPNVGLYYDIDYWVRPERSMENHEIIGKIKDFGCAGWERSSRVRDLILGD